MDLRAKIDEINPHFVGINQLSYEIPKTNFMYHIRFFPNNKLFFHPMLKGLDIFYLMKQLCAQLHIVTSIQWYQVRMLIQGFSFQPIVTLLAVILILSASILIPMTHHQLFSIGSHRTWYCPTIHINLHQLHTLECITTRKLDFEVRWMKFLHMEFPIAQFMP